MKSQFKRFSKSSISVVLCLCMLVTCVTAGIITTDAAKIDSGAATDALSQGSEAVGAAVPDDDSVGRGAGYILFGTSDNPEQWSDTGANVNQSSNIYTASIPKSKFTATGTNYYIGLSSSSSYTNMFFQSSSITVVATGSWFSGSGSQSRDNYRFARISFSQIPTSDIQVQVNANTNTYTFSYTETAVTTYNVTVAAQTGGKVVVNGMTIAGGGSGIVAVGSTPITIAATASTGYAFDGWQTTGGASVASATNPTTTMTASAVGTVTAKFKDATQTRRIYFDNSVAAWSQPYAYAYDNNDVIYSATWPGTKMTLYKGKIWYADISTSATKVIFDNGSNSDQSTGLTIPWTSYTNPTYYKFKSGSPYWGEYTESTASNVKTATLDPSSTSGMFTNIAATFYDYYTNSECNGNYYSSITASDGWVNGISERNPYRNLNESLSKYAADNGVAYPMYYYANYYDNSFHAQGYTAESFQVNDSNGLGGNSKAVTGLSGTKLENGTIHHYKSGATNENGAAMAMFDEEWLASRSGYTYNGTLATIINTKFPVRKTVTSAGYTKVFCDTSQYWGGQQMKAHLWNTTSDAVDVNMTSEGTNYWSVDCTGYTYVIFYYGSWTAQTQTMTIPSATSTNRTVKIGNDTWIATGTTYLNNCYTPGGQAYYEFDSTGGKDTVYFDDCTSAAPTLYYAANNADGHAKKNGYNDGYSFLPFDNNATGRTGYGKDLGFGMKLEINFTLGRDENTGLENGLVDGVAQKFNFSGDDDLWVFVDDQLILDLGGDHAATTGSINFATKTVSTNPAPYTSLNSATRNTAFSLADKPTHKMTIYYTERGMHESNLKFGFSFAPVDTDLKVNKVVSPANVNTGLRDAVATAGANDTFTVNHYYGGNQAAAEAKTTSIGSGVKYVHTNAAGTHTVSYTGSGGTYPLKNLESAQFTNTLHKADYLNKYFFLQETMSNANTYKYTPDFTVRDRDASKTLTTLHEAADGSGGSFKFNNYAESAVVGDMTPVNLDATFTNYIKTHNLILSKQVLDNLGDKDAPYDTFKFKIEVDVDGSKNGVIYDTYALTYFGDISGTMAASGTNAGTVELQDDQFIIVPGIPENARVRVTEVGMAPQYQLYDVDVSGVTKNSLTNGVWFDMTNDADVEFSNLVWTFEFIYHYPSRLTYYQDDWTAGTWPSGEPQQADDIRIWGDEMEYTVDGKLDANFGAYLKQFPIQDGIVKFYMPDETVSSSEVSIDDVIQVYAPYEDNFKETISWDTRQIIDYGKYESVNHPERDQDDENYYYPHTWTGEATSHPMTIETDEENAEVTVHVYAIVEQDFNLDVDFMLPFSYTKTSNGMQYTYNDDEQHSVTYSPLLSTMGEVVRFQNRCSWMNNGNEVFIEAPECLKMSDGTYKYFYYWKVYKRGDAPNKSTMETTDEKVFRKCYNRSFNLACYEEYAIYPYYGLDAHISSQMAQEADRSGQTFANITWLENSRNQWNYYGGGKAGDENHQNDAANTAKWQNYADRLFNDFVIEYGHNNQMIKDLNNIQTGIVIERVQELAFDPRDPDGEARIADPNNSAYDSAKANTGVSTVVTYVNSNFTNRGGKALINSSFANTELDNKNMIEQYYSFANYSQFGTKSGLDWEVATDQTTLRNYLYRAYAYIKVGNSSAVVSAPVYYTIWNEATAGHVTDPIYV